MLKKIAAFLTVKGGETFGFRSACELGDCGKDIMAVFGILDFHWDYENVWEWVEGKGANGLEVNVSRPHKHGKGGHHDIPVVIKLSCPISLLTSEFCGDCAQKLANRLRTEVWIGCVSNNTKDEDDYDFAIERRFTPVD